MRPHPTMRPHPITLAIAVLAATAPTVAIAAPDGTWQNVAVADGVTPGVPGIAGAIYVPFDFNNPVIDAAGRMTFRARIAGPGVTDANSRMIFSGAPGNLAIVARDGSPVPGNNPADYVFNLPEGYAGVSGSTTISQDGGIAVPGFINGPGVTDLNGSAIFFIPPTGAPSLIGRQGDPCPGTAGATMLAMLYSASGQQFTDVGQTLLHTPLADGDTNETNDEALVILGPSGHQLALRKGTAAPGFTDGTTLTPKPYGFMLNGSKFACAAQFANSPDPTTSNDDVLLTNLGTTAGQLRILAREGSPIPGLGGLTFAADAGTPELAQHAIEDDGAILLTASLGGTATAANNGAVMTERNGTYSILLRKGDAVPGITDSANADFAGKRLQGVNTTGFLRNRNGLLAYQGAFMNADGSGIEWPRPSTFVGARRADGTVFTLCRESDPVPGSPGWFVGSLNGVTGICATDTGVVVFNTNIYSGDLHGSTTMAWDQTNGLRVLARTGDTHFTGTPCDLMFLIGSSGSNGNGGCTGISANGWVALTVLDTVNGIQTLARIKVDASAPCPADLNHDHVVNGADLGTLLGNWNGSGEGDLNNDGTVNGADLGTLLGAWGPCP